MKNKMQNCCFFGHRKIIESERLISGLKTTLEDLIINKNVNTFLFGSRSEFDNLCHEIVTELKTKHPHIKRIYVRAEYQYIDADYRDYLLENYEDTYFPESIGGSGKAIYIKRNYHMIDNCGFCVVYYDDNYTLPQKSHKSTLSYNQPKSGTKTAYEYALKKGVKIINMFISD